MAYHMTYQNFLLCVSLFNGKNKTLRSYYCKQNERYKLNIIQVLKSEVTQHFCDGSSGRDERALYNITYNCHSFCLKANMHLLAAPHCVI